MKYKTKYNILPYLYYTVINTKVIGAFYRPLSPRDRDIIIIPSSE